MINITRLAKKFTKNLSLWEWILVKLDLLVLGVLIAKLWPVLTTLHRGWYVGFGLLVEIYFTWRITHLPKN